MLPELKVYDLGFSSLGNAKSLFKINFWPNFFYLLMVTYFQNFCCTYCDKFSARYLNSDFTNVTLILNLNRVVVSYSNVSKDVDRMANSVVDSDQTAQDKSNQGIHCLQICLSKYCESFHYLRLTS